MNTIHILLADDQVLFVESLKKVIEGLAEDIVVDDIAHDGYEVLKRIEKHKSSIILMDVRMPHMDGVETTKIIHSKYPEIRVIMLTTFDDDEYVRQAIRNGAVGYLLKDIPPEDLISAVRATSDGAFLISPSIVSKLINRNSTGKTMQSLKSITEKNMPLWLKSLSKRELDVLSCMAHGMSNKQIAETLFIAEQTVKNYISVIYSKLGENDRFQLIEKIKQSLDEGHLNLPAKSQDSGRRY